VLAAAVAMGLTVVAVVSSKSGSSVDTVIPSVSPGGTGVTEPSPPSTPPPRATPPAATVAAVPALRSIRVESEPSGASVSENGTELCMSTPCELVWKGDAAAAEHKLSLSKRGYKTAKVNVARSDEKVSTKLDIIPISVIRPQGNGGKSTDGKPQSKPNPYGD
jgi:hypothetical protein